MWDVDQSAEPRLCQGSEIAAERIPMPGTGSLLNCANLLLFGAKKSQTTLMRAGRLSVLLRRLPGPTPKGVAERAGSGEIQFHRNFRDGQILFFQ